MRPGAQGSPGLTAERAQGARPARPPAAGPDEAKRLAPPGAARRIFWDWRPDGKAGPARPQPGALGRSDPRPAVSCRPLARPVPPSFPLPQLSQASLRRGVVTSKMCSPPSSDSPLLLALDFSRLLISLASAFPFSSPRPSSPRPGLSPRPESREQLASPQEGGQDPSGEGEGGRGRAGLGLTPPERMRKSCNICRRSSRWRGGGREAAPPPGGKPRPARPSSFSARPRPGAGERREGASWNSMEPLRQDPV